MLNTAKRIDKFNKEIAENYVYLEDQKKALAEKIATGEITQDQSDKQLSSALNILKATQREMATQLRAELEQASLLELEKIQAGYKSVTQDNKAELDLLAEAGNLAELERSAKKYENNPLALLRLAQIAKDKNIAIMITVYEKENRLNEYFNRAKTLIESTARYKNDHPEDIAKLRMINNGKSNDAERLFNSYRNPDEFAG